MSPQQCQDLANMASQPRATVHDLPNEVLRMILSHVETDYNVCKLFWHRPFWHEPYELILWIVDHIGTRQDIVCPDVFNVFRVCKAWSVVVLEIIWPQYTFSHYTQWSIGARAMQALEKSHDIACEELLTGDFHKYKGPFKDGKKVKVASATP